MKKSKCQTALPPFSSIFSGYLLPIMHRYRTYFCSILVCLSAVQAIAADSLKVIKSIPMDGRIMNVDDLGNVYVVRSDNSLVKYTDVGDSLTFYRSVLNGDIGSVDVTNPLRVVVYYPSYAKVILLDRMLAPKNELDLKKIHIVPNATVALSADGNLWVYDKFNARLLKIDENMQQVGESNDLRQQIAEVPEPSYMVERERKLYLCDTINGIYTFDQYGTYINTLTLYGVQQLQVYGTQLVYRHADTLKSYDLRKTTGNELILPHRDIPIITAALGRHTLYVLYADVLILFRMPEEQ